MTDIIQVAELFCDSVKKYGKKKMIKAIEYIHRQKITEKSHTIIDFIIDSCCDTYNVNKSEIMKDVVSGDSYEAREMAIVLINQKLNFKQIETARIFNKKSPICVTLAINSFKNKNPKIKTDLIFLDNYKLLNEKVNNFIESL